MDTALSYLCLKVVYCTGTHSVMDTADFFLENCSLTSNTLIHGYSWGFETCLLYRSTFYHRDTLSIITIHYQPARAPVYRIAMYLALEKLGRASLH